MAQEYYTSNTGVECNYNSLYLVHTDA